MAAKIRKGDRVEVISGDHRGEQGQILRIDKDKNRVIVEGVNLVYRHLRPSRSNPQGGRIRKEAPIHMSNVLPVDPKTARGSRVHFEIERDSAGAVVSKKRTSKSGTVLEEAKSAAR
jgi:large subunit ribosomal protein L24